MSSGSRGRQRSTRRVPRTRRAAPSTPSSPAVLPGYYFDREKNRYFKLESGGPGAALARAPDTCSAGTAARPAGIKPLQPQQLVKTTCPGTLPALMWQRALGQIPSALFQRRAYQVSAFGSKKQVVTASCHRGTVSHLQINERQDMLLASANAGHGAALWKYTITKCDKFYIHIARDENSLFSPSSQITDVSFVPQSVHPGSVALVSLLGGPGQQGRVNVFDLDEGAFISTHYVPLKSNVWSCCWSRQDHCKIYIGASREAYIQDISSNTRQVLHTNKSDVFCVRSLVSSPLVYTGSRNKLLICHDARSKDWAFQIEHQSSVGDIRIMKSEHSLICAAFNGQVVQWDVRTQRHVVAYQGHVNDYAHIKMKLDESESLLFIPGKDLQTRIWGVDTGHLINTMPPPAEDSNISHHNIPACEVALNWAGFHPGFAIAATGILHWYSL